MHRAALLWSVAFLALVLSAAGCAVPIDSTPQSGKFLDASAFFWTRSDLERGVHYEITGDSTTEHHTLTSSDRIHITDVTSTSTGALLMRAGTDSIVVDSISTHTIFLLPPGFEFGGRAPIGVPLTTVIQNDDRILAGSRQNGIYYTDDRSTWQVADGVTGSVNALANDSLTRRLVAASADSLLVSTTNGMSWRVLARPHPGIDIHALAADGQGRVYVGYASTYGVEQMDSSLKQLNSFAPGVADVISIAITKIAIRNYVGVATANLVTLYNDSSRELATFAHSAITELQRVGPASMVLVADNGLTDLSIPGLNSSVEPGSATEELRCAAPFNAETYAGSSNGTLYRFASSGASNLGRASASINRMFVDTSGTVLMATDDGLWSFSGSSVQRMNGPYMDQPRNAAPALLLLTRVNNSLQMGDSWSAGNLYISAVQTSVPVTARVLDHVDTLLSPAGVSFGETYVVRYGFESQNATLSAGFPVYWLVYYSRDAGPTIIEEYAADVGSAYRLKSRAAMTK
jgi:hypothetical protein